MDGLVEGVELLSALKDSDLGSDGVHMVSEDTIVGRYCVPWPLSIISSTDPSPLRREL